MGTPSGGRYEAFALPQPTSTSLFDGRSLDGWEGDGTLFRVADGAIVGGTLEQPIARTAEYVEPDELAQDGVICLQAHVGGPSLARYRDIEIRRLQAR
jgi:hypothetical protein